ncbi:hypothetical protein U1872_13180 [Sphingomonas sp. RB3P16]|uniref:hypothetical protein n=1 Tax=Parasphingomonas frigoris TaxID=3096163 RepID=UPI002FC8C611
MIVLALVLAQPATSLTLGELRKLSPAAAGDAVLRDQPHGAIATFEAPTGGMNAPDTTEGQLLERPTASGSGCVRRRWTVQFRAPRGADISTAMVGGVYSTQEIAAISRGVCPAGRYVHLNPGVTLGQGWEALARLKDGVSGARQTQFQCADATASGLCGSSKAIRSALSRLTPWTITHDAGDVVLWLGEPGKIVTEVRFKAADPSHFTVTRSVPAPF